MTTALLNDTPAEFVQANQGLSPNGPAVLTLLAPVALSLQDIVAVLYDMGDGLSADDLADDDYARHIIADFVFNAGLIEIDALRHAVAAIGPDHQGYRWLCYARRRAAQLFPDTAPTPARPRRTARRTPGRTPVTTGGAR